MIAAERRGASPRGLKLVQALLVLAFAAHSADAQLKNGLYKITYRGAGPCRGKNLVYKKQATDYPAAGYFDSSASPALWELRREVTGDLILRAFSRARCCPAQLSTPSLSCSSRTANLNNKGSVRWKVTSVKGSPGTYILASVTRSNRCSATGMGRLGPISISGARCATTSAGGIQLYPLNRTTEGLQWRLTFVSPTPPPPSPPPVRSPPPPPVRPSPSPPPPSPPPIPPSPPPPSPPPPSPPPPAPGTRPDFCSNQFARRVNSGRRIASQLSGIRPCFGPKVSSAAQCCALCFNNPTCVSFTFVASGALDCRAQGDPGPTAACYLMENYTGSYNPEIDAFGYESGRAF